MRQLLSEIKALDAYNQFYSSIPWDNYFKIISGTNNAVPSPDAVASDRKLSKLNLDTFTRFLVDCVKNKDATLEKAIKTKQEVMGLDVVSRQRFNEEFGKSNCRDFDEMLEILDDIKELKGLTYNSLAKDGYRSLGKIGDWVITVTTTYAANNKLFGATGARWCTASDRKGVYDGYKMFNRYTSQYDASAILVQLQMVNKERLAQLGADWRIQIQVFYHGDNCDFGDICNNNNTSIGVSGLQNVLGKDYEQIIGIITNPATINELLGIQAKQNSDETLYQSRTEKTEARKKLRAFLAEVAKGMHPELKFNDGWARIQYGDGDGDGLATFNYCNKKGKLLSRKWFEYAALPFYGGYALVANNSNDFNVIDTKGYLYFKGNNADFGAACTKIAELIYARNDKDKFFNYTDLSNGLTLIATKLVCGNLMNLINSSGKFVLAKWAGDIQQGAPNQYVIKYQTDLDGRYENYVLKKDGTFLFSEPEGEISYIGNELYSVHNRDGAKLYHSDGELASSKIFSHIHNFSEGFAVVIKNALYGKTLYNYIDTEGNIVLAEDLYYAQDFQGGRAIICTRGWRRLYYLIDSNMQLISDGYYKIERIDNPKYFIVENENYHFNYIDRNGNLINKYWLRSGFSSYWYGRTSDDLIAFSPDNIHISAIIPNSKGWRVYQRFYYRNTCFFILETFKGRTLYDVNGNRLFSDSELFITDNAYVFLGDRWTTLDAFLDNKIKISESQICHMVNNAVRILLKS